MTQHRGRHRGGGHAVSAPRHQLGRTLHNKPIFTERRQVVDGVSIIAHTIDGHVSYSLFDALTGTELPGKYQTRHDAGVHADAYIADLVAQGRRQHRAGTLDQPPVSPAFGPWLTSVMAHRGLCRRDVAIACGVTSGIVGHWRNGAKGPRYRDIPLLARVLAVPEADVWEHAGMEVPA